MKQKISIVLIAIVAILLTGCSTGRYVNNSLNMNMNQTQVVLSTNNFRVIKTVSAYVEYKSNLKFDYSQLQQNAYAELIRKAKLQGSQMLVNVTLENVQRTSGIWVKTYRNGIMAQGVVIEFCNPDKVNESIEVVEVSTIAIDDASNDTEHSAQGNNTKSTVSKNNLNPQKEKTTVGLSTAPKLNSDEIQIADEKFRAVLLQQFDTNKDSYLSKQELIRVQYLDLRNLQINDLAGIEHMPSLASLYASGNNLSNIDLSSNPQLRLVILRDNNDLKIIKIKKDQKIRSDLNRKVLSSIIQYK